MKRDNNLIKITNTKTGESRYFTKDSIAMTWIGCSLASMQLVKGNKCTKFNYIKYEIVDGGDILYKNINNV